MPKDIIPNKDERIALIKIEIIQVHSLMLKGVNESTNVCCKVNILYQQTVPTYFCIKTKVFNTQLLQTITEHTILEIDNPRKITFQDKIIIIVDTCSEIRMIGNASMYSIPANISYQDMASIKDDAIEQCVSLYQNTLQPYQLLDWPLPKEDKSKNIILSQKWNTLFQYNYISGLEDTRSLNVIGIIENLFDKDNSRAMVLRDVKGFNKITVYVKFAKDVKGTENIYKLFYPGILIKLIDVKRVLSKDLTIYLLWNFNLERMLLIAKYEQNYKMLDWFYSMPQTYLIDMDYNHVFRNAIKIRGEIKEMISIHLKVLCEDCKSVLESGMVCINNHPISNYLLTMFVVLRLEDGTGFCYVYLYNDIAQKMFNISSAYLKVLR